MPDASLSALLDVRIPDYRADGQASYLGLRPITLAHLDAQSSWRAACPAWAWCRVPTRESNATGSAVPLVWEDSRQRRLPRAVVTWRHASRLGPGLQALQLCETGRGVVKHV